MNRFIKKTILSLSLVAVLGLTFVSPVLAFGFNPVTFLEKTSDLITRRVSDIIYYLIMQKRYIFDGFVDPNNYLSVKIPEVESALPGIDLASTSPTPKEVNQTKPITPVANIIEGSVNTPKPVSVVEPAVKPVTVINSLPSEPGDNSQILYFTNKEREKLSLTPLVSNAVLDRIASLRVDDLFANQYFEHTSPVDGQTITSVAAKVGYPFLLVGENLALGNFVNEQDMVTAWMESPSHRENILNGKYQELGVAMKTDVFKGEETTIAVQVFGTPLSNCSIPNQSTKSLIDSSTASIKKMQEEAAVLYNNLNEIKNDPQIDRSYYSQKVSEYNYFAKKINDAVLALKNLTDFYNIQVNSYNNCINH